MPVADVALLCPAQLTTHILQPKISSFSALMFQKYHSNPSMLAERVLIDEAAYFCHTSTHCYAALAAMLLAETTAEAWLHKLHK